MKAIHLLPLCFALLLGLSMCQNSNQNCKFIPGYEGLGDFAKLGNYYIAASDDRFLDITNPSKYNSSNGKLLLIDPQNARMRELKLNNFPNNVAFHPLGVSIYNNQVLFVINHAGSNGGERIEVFNINYSGADTTLTFSLSFVLGSSLNWELYGIAAVDKNKFFVSQFLANPGTLKDGLLNSNLSGQSTYAMFCDMKALTCTQLPETAGTMNTGIAYDSQNNLLYIADLLGKVIRVFNVSYGQNYSNLSLSFNRNINLDYYPNNILLDKSNNKLYVGVFKQAQDLINFTKTIDQSHSFPNNFNTSSGVISIDLNNNDQVNTIIMQKAYFFVNTGFVENGLVTMTSFYDEGAYICPTSSS